MQLISKTDLGNREQILDGVQKLVEYINHFNTQFMIIETEDRENICSLIELCADLAGFPFPKKDLYLI